MLMNKTIKQAERYEAPCVKDLKISIRQCLMAVSDMESNTTPDMCELQETWE